MKKVLTFLCACTASAALFAQDPHFSQYYTQPLLLNPAVTGFFKGDYRATTDYKNQWTSIPTPYNTYTASADMRSITGHTQNIIGLGMMAMSDKAGDGQFKTTSFGFSFSYLKNLDHFGIQYFGGGLMASLSSANLNYDYLRFEDAYVSQGPTAEPGNNTMTYFDVSLGTFYSYALDQRKSIEAGAAVYHLNQPVRSFFGNSDSKVFRKYMVHASGNYWINPRFDFYPKAMISFQGPHHEINFGGFMRIKLDHFNTSRYGMYLGSWFRWNDAIIPTMRLDLDKFSFAFSYDINYSALRAATVSRGGPELSLIFIGKGVHRPKGAFFPRF